MESRACNVAFYKWYIETIVVEFVRNQRTVNGLSDTEIAFFQLDGEKVQVECFNHPDCLKILNDNYITVGKPPASTTATTQPCDCGNCFKASKKALANIKDAHVRFKQKMSDKIKKLLNDFNKSLGKKKKMSYGNIGSAVKGILRIQLALTNTVNPTMISKSFAAAGVWDHDLNPPGVNIKTIFGNNKDYFGEGLSIEDEAAITAGMPTLVERLRQRGELFETDFDDCNIRHNINPKEQPKENFHIPRRRYCFLTNPVFVQRQHETMMLAQQKKEKAASRKRKNVVAVAEDQPQINKIGKLNSNAPILENVDAFTYVCANPTCGVTSAIGDADNGWLQCECCEPPCWTCGECTMFMQQHEELKI